MGVWWTVCPRSELYNPTWTKSFVPSRHHIIDSICSISDEKNVSFQSVWYQWVVQQFFSLSICVCFPDWVAIATIFPVLALLLQIQFFTLQLSLFATRLFNWFMLCWNVCTEWGNSIETRKRLFVWIKKKKIKEILFSRWCIELWNDFDKDW